RPFVHAHKFGDAAAPRRERALWWVTVITLATMGLELVVGYWSGSLALVADGWHMGTHALALGGAALAARIARRAHGSARFAFGGWKIEVLAAYSSGLLLLAVSVWIGIDAIGTLLTPHAIAYAQAMVVAVIGLVVNASCAWLLSRGAHGHDHGHAHPHGHGAADSHGHTHAASPPGHAHGHHDHNYRAATLHVMADALTSVLAIVALGAGMAWGWRWLDPLVALAGGALIAHWALGVLRDAARCLVDASPDLQLRDAVRGAIETDGDAHVADLHVWQVGPAAWSAVLSVVADRPLAPEAYRARLHDLTGLQHVTIEVHQCRGEAVASHR
ncbi:MAG TPA: CDF family Co(II)/Ni(II) efflux transporter DmeF, partial [Burkholderiaceae bacterium]|nr:CDF family Co(II)/Ni(II) efflux transporter DmeF [Burkholderiaceae bacterium]